MIRVPYNESLRLNWNRNENGIGIAGQTVQLTIKRLADGKYWDGDSWEVARTLLSATETSSTNAPGDYHYDFTFDTEDQYEVYWTIASGAYEADETLMFLAEAAASGGVTLPQLQAELVSVKRMAAIHVRCQNNIRGNYPTFWIELTGYTSVTAPRQVSIQRSSDNYYWNGSGWQAGGSAVNMSAHPQSPKFSYYKLSDDGSHGSDAYFVSILVANADGDTFYAQAIIPILSSDAGADVNSLYTAGVKLSTQGKADVLAQTGTALTNYDSGAGVASKTDINDLGSYVAGRFNNLDSAVAQLFTLVSGGQAAGQVYCVDGKDGSDSNDGADWTTPFKTIGKAFTVLDADDEQGTVFAKGYKYEEDVDVSENCRLIGVNWNYTILGGLWSTVELRGSVAPFTTNPVLTLRENAQAINVRVGCEFKNPGTTEFLKMYSGAKFLHSTMGGMNGWFDRLIHLTTGLGQEIGHCWIDGVATPNSGVVIGADNVYIHDTEFQHIEGTFIKTETGSIRYSPRIINNRFNDIKSGQTGILAFLTGKMDTPAITGNLYSGEGDFLDISYMVDPIYANNEQWAKETTAQEILTDVGALAADIAAIKLQTDQMEFVNNDGEMILKCRVDAFKVGVGFNAVQQGEIQASCALAVADLETAVGLLGTTELKAIEFDFTTYVNGAVVLFYDADRPFGVATPYAWCYVYTPTGGRPSNSSEIAKRDRVKLWATVQPS